MDTVTVDTVKKQAHKVLLSALFVAGLLILTVGMGFKVLMWTAGRLVTPEAIEIYKSVYATTTQTYRKYYAEFPFQKEQTSEDTVVLNADEPSDTTTVATSDGTVDAPIDSLPGMPIVSMTLSKLGIRELKKIASLLKLKGYSNMTVLDLTINIYEYMHSYLDTDQCLKLIEEVQQSKEITMENFRNKLVEASGITYEEA